MKNRRLLLFPFVSLVLQSLAAPFSGATTVTGTAANIGTSNNLGSTSYSSAFGTDNIIEGDVSFATGSNNRTGYASFAAGASNQMLSTSTGSTVFNFALGEVNTISGAECTTVIGALNNVNVQWDSEHTIPTPTGGADLCSFIAGGENYILYGENNGGIYNVLLGYANGINLLEETEPNPVQRVVLIGSENRTIESDSWVLGKGNIGQTGTVTLGTYNATVSGASLILGNGEDDSTRSNALVVMKNGDVAISGALTVGGSPTVTTGYLSTNKYLKPAYGTGAVVSGGGLFAFGDAATADNLSSWAVGTHASSTGVNSIALGEYSSSWGYNSTAFGSNAMAGGSFSQSFGASALAFGDWSTAIGTDSYTGGERSIALAGGAVDGAYSFASNGGIANGDHSIAFTNAAASGDNSIAMGGRDSVGFGNEADGDHATAIGGYHSTAAAAVSFTSGYKTKTTAAYSTVLGSSNLSASGTSLVPADSSTWADDEVLFELGNGEPDYSPTQYSNAITTLKNGRTTLTNKFWSSADPEDVPSATGSSDGEALIVEGHAKLKGNAEVDGTTTLNGDTVINGKVILTTAQGDISMGIYE